MSNNKTEYLRLLKFCTPEEALILMLENCCHDIKTFEFILKKGFNIADKHEEFIHNVIEVHFNYTRTNHEDHMKYLKFWIDNNFDLSHKDKLGRTPLMIAREKAGYDVSYEFIEKLEKAITKKK